MKKTIILTLMFLICVASVLSFDINTNITYNSDFFLFNFSGDQPSNITILPNATEPFEVCLEDMNGSSDCINYTSGFFNKTFSWNGIIDWDRSLRFKIDWSRYDNGSDIKAVSSSCYQETANISTSCGGLATGDYSIESNFFYINYTKPHNALNSSLWQAKYGNSSGGPYLINMTIPTVCWVQSLLQFRMNVSSNPASSNFVQPQCYNGSYWNNIGDLSQGPGGGTSGGVARENLYDGDWDTQSAWSGIDWKTVTEGNIEYGRVYEEAMFWKLKIIEPQFSSYFSFDNQSPVTFSGDLTTNSNVSYEVANQVEFVSPSFEFEELSHNITFLDKLTNLRATLVYNNTENVIDGTNFSVTGDRTKFVTNFFKNVSSETTFSFYWNYSFELPNGTTLFFNTSTFSQTIKEISFNTSCDNPVMNITFSDEETLSPLLSNIDLSIERMFFGDDIIILNESLNLTNINNTEICFNAEDFSQRFDMVFNYDSSGYTTRIYNFLDTLTSGVIRTQPLFLSNDGNITNIFITLFDQNSERLSNYYVKVDRFYPAFNFYKNIETVKSDVNGETLFHLIPFLVEYRFRVFNFAGDEVKRVERTTIKSSTPSITIQTGEAFLEDFDDLNSATKSLTFDNDTKEVVWQATSVFSQSCLAVIRVSSGGETLYDNCQSGAVVVDSYTITENTTNEFYEFRGYFLDENNNVIGGEFMSHSEPADPFRYGLLGVLLTLIITVTLFMLGINNPATAITLGFTGLLISAYLRFVVLSFGMIILLAIMVGFLLYKMRT